MKYGSVYVMELQNKNVDNEDTIYGNWSWVSSWWKKNLHDESDVTHGCGDAALGEFKQWIIFNKVGSKTWVISTHQYQDVGLNPNGIFSNEF